MSTKRVVAILLAVFSAVAAACFWRDVAKKAPWRDNWVVEEVEFSLPLPKQTGRSPISIPGDE